MDLTPAELFLTLPELISAMPAWNFAADESFIRFHSKVWIPAFRFFQFKKLRLMPKPASAGMKRGGSLQIPDIAG